MNYNETVGFLFSQLPAYHRIGKAAYKNDLDNTLALDEYSGHPHRKYKTIHIAGTNGKGSVSHMVASVLAESGYRTGLYTSPHLKDFRERIRINGKMIPKSAVTRFVKDHKEIIDSLKPSFFEMTVAMAFSYFAEAGADVAVIEAGLGGRLDSTNIINPVLSVITNIGHDHMDLLGDTLQKVAAEKAGIIKPMVPVVISETQTELMDIFMARAAETGSEISFADRNYLCETEEYDVRSTSRNFKVTEISSGRPVKGRTVLTGDYQAKNLQAVFQIFKTLKGFVYTEHEILKGIVGVVRNTGLVGRWQVIGKKPLVVCDTGHNMEGLESLFRQINRIPKNRLHVVIGFVKDKDISSLLSLMPGDAVYYFTRASVPRALDETTLMSLASEKGLKGRCFSDVGSALKAAKANAEESDMIFIGGSTFIVAEVI